MGYLLDTNVGGFVMSRGRSSMPSPRWRRGRGPGRRVGVTEQDDLIADLIAEVARSHGVAISRDNPIVAVVLLNQIVLRRYLGETVAPAADAIRDATTEAVRQIEQFAEAQATWLEQVSLKDRPSLLEEQKALHDARKTEGRRRWSSLSGVNATT